MKMMFRKDINGLRAIAVIAVVLYHFNKSWIPGGFAGVDIFFVISGFLMTKIIFSGISNGTFQAYSFYKSRAKRIIPALTVLCFSVLIFAWFFVAPADYQTISKHVFTSLTFISNIGYWQEAGYFDAISKSKWLLHTWSLSAEWQFYIIYPLVIIGLLKVFKEKIVLKIILGLFLISFILCLYASFKWPDASYYLLPTRSWEMLMGGIIYLYPIKRLEKHTSLATIIGGFLIFSSFFIMSENDIWPGYLALLPTLGTAIILSVNNQSNAILNNIVIQKIGAWSYSIYLWHWVVLSFIYFFDPFFGLHKQILGILFSVILGCCSFYLIEKNNFNKANILMYLLTINFAAWVFISNGAQTSIREYTAQYDLKDWVERYKGFNGPNTFGEYWAACNSKAKFNTSTNKAEIDQRCINTEMSNSVFLLGDSHAAAYSTALRAIFKNDISFDQLASSGCRPSWDKKDLKEKISAKGVFELSCHYQNILSYKAIRDINPRIVILAQRNLHDRSSLLNVVNKLVDWGIEKVVIIGPVPQWLPSLPSILSKKNRKVGDFLISSSLDDSILKTNEALKIAIPNSKKIVFIDVVGSFCQEIGSEVACKFKIDNNNLVTFDYGHPTPEYSQMIVNKLLRNQLPEDMLK
ncbi:MAG: peptidoglycan/LPS O-acetylase OafA/YrhL [Psychromonas sp.]|jgi:peptidoglycan/LPS O-acetylase OafA/YrhL|uniref:acyltransferase family protein n=1 Tax=Psychromonas sp. TaxID=1884585 RepID=UPI0039E6C422